MKALLLALLLLLLGAATAEACTNTTPIVGDTEGVLELVPGVEGQRIYLCGWVLTSPSSGPVTDVQLVAGRGANCTTDQIAITPVLYMSNGTPIVNRVTEPAETVPAGLSLCGKLAKNGVVSGIVYWAQYP